MAPFHRALAWVLWDLLFIGINAAMVALGYVVGVVVVGLISVVLVRTDWPRFQRELALRKDGD